MKTPIIETEKLSKSYAADGVQTHVLSNIDLVLHEGDFTAIMGVGWFESTEPRPRGTDLLQEALDQVRVIKDRLRPAQSRH